VAAALAVADEVLPEVVVVVVVLEHPQTDDDARLLLELLAAVVVVADDAAAAPPRKKNLPPNPNGNDPTWLLLRLPLLAKASLRQEVTIKSATRRSTRARESEAASILVLMPPSLSPLCVL